MKKKREKNDHRTQNFWIKMCLAIRLLLFLSLLQLLEENCMMVKVSYESHLGFSLWPGGEIYCPAYLGRCNGIQ